MSETVEEAPRELPGEVDAIVPQVGAVARFDHLYAFNFGRSLGRMEMARDLLWLSLRWLLFGAAVGIFLAAVYLQLFLNPGILQIAR
jgi:hypothetical protein